MKGLGLLALVAACGSDELTARQYDDVAAVVGASVATPDRGGDLGAITDSLSIARGDLPKNFVLASDGSVVGTRGGIEYTYRVMCLSPWESYPAFAACDPPASSAVVQARWTGQLAMGAFDGTMTREGVWRLDYLSSPMGIAKGGTQLIAQQATFSTDRAFDHRTYWITDDQELQMFAEMSSQTMMAGNVTSNVNVTTDDGDYYVTSYLEITSFPTAKLTLDEYEYTVDLDTGEVTRGAPSVGGALY